MRCGSLYDPVAAAERFGLITCNPPFMIAPPQGLVALSSVRDAGEGDALTRAVVGGAGAHLDDEGYAVVIGDWGHAGGGAWDATPRSWVAGKGTDAWIIGFQTYTPEQYARRWLRETRVAWAGGSAAGEIPAEELARWLRHYEALGIGAITFGAVIQRKRGGGVGPWVMADFVGSDIANVSHGDQVERVFAGKTLVMEGPRAVAQSTLRLTGHHDVEQHLTMIPGEGWVVQSGRITQTDGFGFGVNLAGAIMDLLSRLDGSTSVEASIRAGAAAAGMGAHADAAVAQGVALAGKLLEKGYLEVVSRGVVGRA